MSSLAQFLVSSRLGKEPAKRPAKKLAKRPPPKEPAKQPPKAANGGSWPRPCEGRSQTHCQGHVHRSEAHVWPCGDVWHAACVHRYIRLVREAIRGFSSGHRRQRRRELRAYFGIGNSLQYARSHRRRRLMIYSCTYTHIYWIAVCFLLNSYLCISLIYCI